MQLAKEDRVAALTAELAQVKAENAKLRESQSDTSGELSHIRASLANAEIGLAALRTTTDENEAHRRVTAAEIASNLAQVSTENAKLRESAARNRLSGGVITNCFEEMPDGASKFVYSIF